MILPNRNEIKETAVESSIVFHFYPKDFFFSNVVSRVSRDLNNLINCAQICQDPKVCCQTSEVRTFLVSFLI